MARVYNFSAGPSALPEDVLEVAAEEMLDYKGTGMGVMEMSHRSPAYQNIIDSAEADLRKLMNVPDNYKILFLQGGASSQFAMIPLNLLSKNKKADYVNTGAWSKKAIQEAKRFGDINVVASSDDKTFNYIPELDKSRFDTEADYFHITMNNTIYGTLFAELPDTGDVPVVADMSSNILSQGYDVSKFGVIYAGAQKNIGPAGVTVVIIRDDLMGKALAQTPVMFDFKTHSDAGSMYNTPPTYGIYIAGLVFKRLLDMGGVAAVEKINLEKAALLYDFLDASSLFSATVEKKDRSIMNIPFVTGSDELDAAFIKGAKENGLVNLKGHRSVGGMRASIYNAVSLEAVTALVDFMKKFENENR